MTTTERPGVEVGAAWDTFREHDPRLFAAYEALARVPWATGPLPPKVKELVGIAAASTASGIDAPSLHAHVANALALGASKAEIVEVFQLVSVIGIHTCVAVAPVLLEELRRAGLPEPASDAPRAAEVRAIFEARRGYWSSLWDAVVALDPEFLLAYMAYSSIPGETGALEPKVRELILVALSSVTTHLFPEGARVHIRTALRLGATAAEIMEVFELVSTIGVRTQLAGLPILAEALDPSRAD
jgi:alkylhydroperoxidase/carboxymuconolactone decarboxylase family protein YurZ